MGLRNCWPARGSHRSPRSHSRRTPLLSLQQQRLVSQTSGDLESAPRSLSPPPRLAHSSRAQFKFVFAASPCRATSRRERTTKYTGGGTRTYRCQCDRAEDNWRRATDCGYDRPPEASQKSKREFTKVRFSLDCERFLDLKNTQAIETFLLQVYCPNSCRLRPSFAHTVSSKLLTD